MPRRYRAKPVKYSMDIDILDCEKDEWVHGLTFKHVEAVEYHADKMNEELDEALDDD